MARKNCGLKLVARIKELTNNLYYDCRTEAFGLIPYIKNSDDNAFNDYIKAVNKLSSDLYQESLRKLSTKDLEDILWVHECKKYIRAPFTIENILSELASRTLLTSTKNKKV